MNWKALLVIAAMLSLTIPILPAHAITVPNPDTFTYLTLGGPETGDGAWAYDTASAELIFNVYQALCDFDFVYYNRYVAELADDWPGYGVNEGNGITPMPPHPHEYTNTTNVDLASPVCSYWTRKGVTYHLSAATGPLEPSQQVTMTWVYNTTMSATEDLEYHVDKVELVDSTYKLTLTPKWIDKTWYFHIRPNVKWQLSAYGTVTPYDCEYSFERGMVLDHAGGPQWMFFEPLTPSFGTRDGTWNIPKYKYWDPTKPDQTAMLGRWIDDAVESNSTHMWFNLDQPYVPFQQILCQSWGSILDAEWTMLQEDPVGGKNWNASWHVTPGLEGYLSWIAYSNPPTPGPLSFDMMGQGPYYLDYVDPLTGYWRIKEFADYWGMQPGQPYYGLPHVTTAIHEVVLEWADRILRFLSDDPATQADMIAIERFNVVDDSLVAAVDAGRVRYLKDLPTLVADAVFFCYEYLAETPPPDYMHYLGGVANRTLLSDRNMRLGLIKCYNASQFIEDVYLGEGLDLHDPIIYGIAYANATKHSLMHYTKNIDEATYYFKMAWGGSDPDGIMNSGDEVPGEAWTKGFQIRIVYFPISDVRKAPGDMIEFAVEHQIPGAHGTFLVDNIGLDWKPGLTQMYSGNLGCYVVGWLADFPDPHNWVMPFMSIYGDFSYFQCVDYGKGKMNWHPEGDYGKGPNDGFPYTNYNGETVTGINNTYVEFDLIRTGIGIVDPTVREKCYTELMDIFYAEAATVMTCQPSARHYERQWVHGWIYNSIYPGLMFNGEEYIWKEDPATVRRDVAVVECYSTYVWSDTAHCWIEVTVVTVTNVGRNPEYVEIHVEKHFSIYSPWPCTWYHGKELAWLRPGQTLALVVIIYCLKCPNWIDQIIQNVTIYGWTLPIADWDMTNNEIATLHKEGDLGTIAGGYFAFDGYCNSEDLFLFRNAYITPPPLPNAMHIADFDTDGDVDSVDLFQFRTCYLLP